MDSHLEKGLPASLRYAVTGRHASFSAKAWGFACRYTPLLRPHRSPRQVGFLAFWSRFAPGGAAAGRACARVGVALAKSPAMPKRA